MDDATFLQNVMPLPPKTLQKFSDRFDELVAEGAAIHEGIRFVDQGYDNRWLDSNNYPTKRPDRVEYDHPRLARWKVNCVSILNQVIPPSHPHRSMLATYAGGAIGPLQIRWAISCLEGIRSDFERGLLGDLSKTVEAEIAADYMGQAESLLKQGQTGKYDHVPAAVLAGAVLEKTLRLLCNTQHPPILLENARGEKKTLNSLIDDLKKAGVFNELAAKQLRSWADIRNKAAHGEFDQFSKSDVERMLHGINSFLAEVVK